MAKLFDEDGNEVDGAMTKEEIEAAAKVAADAAIEEYKKNNPPVVAPVEPVVPPKPEDKQVDPEFAALKTTVETLSKENYKGKVERFQDRYAGTDPEKRTAYEQAFERITGFENTDEGMAERAAMAARAAFGSDAPVVDVAGMAGAGSGRTVEDNKAAPTPADLAVRAALGITEEDAKKYGGEEGKK